jgi:putative ABC transport system permease protein
MAWRNLVRRRAQTAIVLAGLLVGTAVVTASLTVADSLRYGIRKATYDGLGPADEFVQLAGQRYFPQSAYGALANDSALSAASHALSPVVIDVGSVRDARTRETEPGVGLAGFDAKLDAPFGMLTLTDGRRVDGSALGPNDAYLREDVARRLDAKVGDTLVVGVQQAGLPLTDLSYPVSGSISGAGAGCPTAPVPVPNLPVQPPCAYTPDPADNTSYTIPVARGAALITILLEPIGPEDSPTRPDLDIIATSPSGNRTAATGGAPGSPSDPAVLRIEGNRYLERGNWIVQVTTKGGAAGKFTGAIFVSYAQYDATGSGAGEGATVVGDADASAYLAVGASSAAHANLTLKGIVTREGKGAFLGTTGLFVGLATAQSLVGQPGMVNAVKISNAHDAAPPTQAATRVLDGLRAANPDDPVYDHLAVAPVKAQGLAAAEQESKFYRDFLAAVSTLTLLAGALLVVHVFILLAAERKRELGAARAIGLQRRDVVLSFTIEGFLLALLAAAGGVLVGVAGAGGVLLGFDYILSAVGTNLGTFVLHPEAQSLLLAAALGFGLTLAAAAGASWRVGGMNLVRALRGQEDDITAPRRSWTGVAGLAVLGALSLAAGPFAALAFGPACLIGILALLPRRAWALALGGLALLVEGALSIFLLTPPADAAGRVMGVLRGVPPALGLALLALNTDALARGAERALSMVKRLRPTAPLAVRYPFRRRGQTGLTVSMFAFVTLVLVFFSIFGTTFALDINGETGGYHVYATTDAPYSDLRYAYDLLPAAARDPYALANVTVQDPLLVATVPGGDLLMLDHARPHYKGAPVDRVYATLPDFPRREQFAFAELDPHYPNGSAAFEAILKDPTLAIVSVAYTLDETGNPGAHHVGADLDLRLASGEKHLRVIGVMKELYLGGVWVNPLVLRTGFQSVQGAYLLRTAPGHDPAEVARQLERSFDGTGLHAVDLKTEAGTVLEENEQFLRMFQMFLGFGLLVGIASLAVVSARSVLERRPHIGVLRALGHTRVSILTWLVGESLLVTILGTLVGVAAGSLLAFGVWFTTVRPVMDVPFSYSYVVIPVILLITYGAAVAAVFLPGFLATRESPAGMVRRVD